MTRDRLNKLGVMSTALLVEFTFALQILFRKLTGNDLPYLSMLLAFTLVCCMYVPLESWLWGTSSE